MFEWFDELTGAHCVGRYDVGNAEEIHIKESDEEHRQLINVKHQINFPPVSTIKQWKALDSKIILQLDKLTRRTLWSTNLTLLMT